MSKQNFKAKILKKAAEDKTFKQKLLDNPKTAIEKLTKKSLPKNLTIDVIEEDIDELILVLPKTTSELSDSDLDNVSGGGLKEIWEW